MIYAEKKYELDLYKIIESKIIGNIKYYYNYYNSNHNKADSLILKFSIKNKYVTFINAGYINEDSKYEPVKIKIHTGVSYESLNFLNTDTIFSVIFTNILKRKHKTEKEFEKYIKTAIIKQQLLNFQNKITNKYILSGDNLQGLIEQQLTVNCVTPSLMSLFNIDSLNCEILKLNNTVFTSKQVTILLEQYDFSFFEEKVYKMLARKIVESIELDLVKEISSYNSVNILFNKINDISFSTFSYDIQKNINILIEYVIKEITSNKYIFSKGNIIIDLLLIIQKKYIKNTKDFQTEINTIQNLFDKFYINLSDVEDEELAELLLNWFNIKYYKKENKDNPLWFMHPDFSLLRLYSENDIEKKLDIYNSVLKCNLSTNKKTHIKSKIDEIKSLNKSNYLELK